MKNYLYNFFYDTLQGFCDLFYPPRCLLCGLWRKKWLCEDCLYKIDDSLLPFCINCGLHFNSMPSVCSGCTSSELIFSVGFYEGALREAIMKLKYGKKIVMGDVLGELMAEKFLRFCKPLYADIIVPVPLHPKKELSRGFNQLEKITKILSSKTAIDYSFSVLKRTRDTLSQASLPYNRRLTNMEKAFRVIDPSLIKGKNVILLDDVYTSGATSGECSRILLDCGAYNVYRLVLAISQKTISSEEDFVKNN